MKKLTTTLLAAMLVFSLGSSALAFSDIKGKPEEKAILSLKEKGIVDGIDAQRFAPNATMTAAQGIQLIVKALELDTGKVRFIRAPKASDSFPKAKDDVWYSESFIIAGVNNLPVDREIDPQQIITKEQFAEWLYAAVEKTGPYPVIQMFQLIGDEDQITPGSMNAIQVLLLTKIAKLDEKGNFQPKKPINRYEAAVLAYNAMEFVAKHKADAGAPAAPQPAEDIKISVTKDSEEFNKVTLSRGLMPNPGYGISIDRVDYVSADEAVVYYTLRAPDPTKMYPAVMTEVEASTTVKAGYKVTAAASK
ncbi:S-layer homology domain-containing protein [Paenibacillus lutrae]|nr:S-layer homology domain-containing protein [Paenibacillus lutrae]